MNEDKRIRIFVKNASKKFVRDNKNISALEIFVNFLNNHRVKNEFLVLDNINLIVKIGENVGIIGKNGSGKSTLLRVIAGIYRIDSGEINTNGELVYLTGFGHGFQRKLTMRENIFLVGSIMGLSQDSIRKRFDDIVNFSGLREYLDTKLFKFSSGMQIRLASSIGLYCVSHKNPDILLVDEVLGAGADLDFQERALDKMRGLIKGGSTVILVSHNLDAIKKYCDRVIWLDQGKVIMEGEPSEVVDNYVRRKINFRSL